MKAFNRIFAALIAVITAIFAAANVILLNSGKVSGRPYKVEISRVAYDMEQGENPDISACKYVTAVVECEDDFYNSESDYVIKNIN